MTPATELLAYAVVYSVLALGYALAAKRAGLMTDTNKR